MCFRAFVKDVNFQVPFFIRGGAVLTIKDRVRRAASLGAHDPVTLIVALDYTVLAVCGSDRSEWVSPRVTPCAGQVGQWIVLL